MSDKIIQALGKAYRMEVETVINYLANSIHLDGLLGEEIKRALAGDVAEELQHAGELANRIKQLGGAIPGSLALDFDQKALQPPEDSTDAIAVIRGVLAAEEEAIAHYRDVIRMSDDDPVTADLATRLLADEEGHRRLFRGFLNEYERRNRS